VEFCAVTLTKNFPGWHADDVRAAMIGYLKGLEEKDLIRKFGKKAPKL
jgi:hypothetical protein